MASAIGVPRGRDSRRDEQGVGLLSRGARDDEPDGDAVERDEFDEIVEPAPKYARDGRPRTRAGRLILETPWVRKLIGLLVAAILALNNCLTDRSSRRRGPPPSLKSRLWNFPRTVFKGLAPSFLRERYFASAREKSLADADPADLYGTKFLQGLRGLAAMSFFMYALVDIMYDAELPYGAKTERQPQRLRSTLRLPLFKMFWVGPAAAYLFFCISGFAQSVKPLAAMREKQHSTYARAIGSTILRRPIRLFVPAFAATFTAFFLAKIGVYEFTRPYFHNSRLFTGKKRDHLQPRPFTDWVTQSAQMVDLFQWNPSYFYNNYDQNLWVIPATFRASLALYLTQMALSRLHSFLRMSILAGLATFLLLWKGQMDLVLFWAGMFLAELHQIMFLAPRVKLGDEPSQPSFRSANTVVKVVWTAAWLADLAWGIYLYCFPNDHAKTVVGYRRLYRKIPHLFRDYRPERLWQSLGALQIVAAVSNVDLIQRVLTIPPLPYLGKISFSLFLVQSISLHTIGFTTFAFVARIVAHKTPAQRARYFATGSAVHAVLTVWVADLFWSYCERPCIAFGNWLQEELLGDD